MKTIRLLLLCVLASMALCTNAQSYLPQKSAFAIGAGPMWGIVEGNGNYHNNWDSSMSYFSIGAALVFGKLITQSSQIVK